MPGEARVFARTRSRPPADPVATRVPFAFVHINKCAGSSVEIALGIPKVHTTALALRERLGAEEWARRFTFSIVRNPFDRVVSIYFFRMRTDQNGLADRHLSFNRWVARVWGEQDPAYIGAPELVMPALGWLTDEQGEVMVDRIARIETLDKEWSEIARVLGIDPALPFTNASLRPPYRSLFSAEARALVEDAFRADLDHFGYDY